MSTLAIEITSERTALVSGAGDEKVELSAENGQSIHAVIAQFSRQHSADAGSPVEVTVQEAGRSRQLTVAPDGTLILKNQTRAAEIREQGTMAMLKGIRKGLELPPSIFSCKNFRSMSKEFPRIPAT